jgi:MFS transporter, ACS family, tartrate transporter
LACAVVSNNAFLPVFWCLPPRFLRGAGAAAGIALINSVGNLGGFIGPTVVGTVKTMTGGFTGAFAVLAGRSFLSALLMLTLPRSSALGRRPAPVVDQLVQTRP